MTNLAVLLLADAPSVVVDMRLVVSLGRTLATHLSSAFSPSKPKFFITQQAVAKCFSVLIKTFTKYARYVCLCVQQLVSYRI